MIGFRSMNWWFRRRREPAVGALGHPGRVERRLPLARVEVDVEVLGVDDLEVELGVHDPVLAEILRRRDGVRGRTARASRTEGPQGHERPEQVTGAGERRGIVPESLELVERPRLRVKEVDHEIHEVEQHPAAGGQSLDVVRVLPCRASASSTACAMPRTCASDVPDPTTKKSAVSFSPASRAPPVRAPSGRRPPGSRAQRRGEAHGAAARSRGRGSRGAASGRAVLHLVEHRPGPVPDMGAEHPGGQRDEAHPAACTPPPARSAPVRPPPAPRRAPRRSACPGAGAAASLEQGQHLRPISCSRPRARSTGTTRPARVERQDRLHVEQAADPRLAPAHPAAAEQVVELVHRQEHPDWSPHPLQLLRDLGRRQSYSASSAARSASMPSPSDADLLSTSRTFVEPDALSAAVPDWKVPDTSRYEQHRPLRWPRPGPSGRPGRTRPASAARWWGAPSRRASGGRTPPA